MRTPVDLVGGFYTDDSLPWSCQDTVNYIPVAAESGGTRTVSKLVDAPGLRPHVWIGNHADGVESAPIRGLHDVEGQLFAVCGRTLYQISNNGIAIPRGTIPGVGRVSMAHNQRSNGNELTIVNGSAGYVWNTSSQTFSVVTDAGYPGASVVDFIDGYLMQVEPFGRFLFHSDLADALEYNTLDRFEAETAPDRTLGMIVNHQEVWAFGERTIDVFGNVGTAQGTFQNKGVSISRGCAAKWSPAVIDNGVAWLGDDLKVYHAVGYGPARISTRAVEVALSECPRTDLRNAFSFVWEDLSHAVYYLTVPNGPTFGYDFSTGLWHRRSSWHPERDLSGRWRINDLVKHNGEWIAGDYQTGKLYKLDWDYMLEGCEPLVRERVSPVAHNDGRAFTIDSAEVFFDTGGKESDCWEYPWPIQPIGPSVSGEAPDGGIGFAYSGFTYTVTEGDAPVVSVEIIDGALPSGLTWNNGTISATAPTAGGSFTITIRATDTNGITGDHTDTIYISPVMFLLFSSDIEGIWITPSLGAPWSSMYPLVPSVGTGIDNATFMGGDLYLDVMQRTTGMKEFYSRAQTPPWGAHVPVLDSHQTESGTSLLPSRFYVGGDVLIGWEQNGNRSYYWARNGREGAWQQFPAPYRTRGFARMDSGRWIAAFQTSSDRMLGYSDEDVPENWTTASSSLGTPSTTSSVAAGRYGFFVNSLKQVFRTDDGASWTQVADISHFPNPGSLLLFMASDGTLIAHGSNASGKVLVSHDDGVNWAEVVFSSVWAVNMTMVSEAGGLLLGSTGASRFYVSEDYGDTWTEYVPPFSGYGNAATIVALEVSDD